MASVAEQIADAVVAKLTVPPMSTVPAARVFRDVMRARRATELPAVAVETGDEVSPVRSLITKKDRRIEIQVSFIAKGDSPYTQCDPALVESHGRIIADLSLGGLAMDILEGPTYRTRDGVDSDYGEVKKTYVIEYRTDEAAI